MQGGSSALRLDLPWAWTETSKGTYDWNAFDQNFALATQGKQRVLIIVGTAPSWASGQTGDEGWNPPLNVVDYADFVAAVLARYGSRGQFWSLYPRMTKRALAGIELWNEPNLVMFWRKGPQPDVYAAMVRAAYTRAKLTDPTVPIVAGALAPQGGYNDGNCDGVADGGSAPSGLNQLNYLTQMYQAGVAGAFDALSVHPYNFASGIPAESVLSFHPCSAWSQMNDTSPSERSLMTQAGDWAKTIWITEFGVPTCISASQYPCMSETEQGRLATLSMQRWRTYAWSGNFFWYELRDSGVSTGDIEQHFGALANNYRRKAAYVALKSAWTCKC